MNPPVSGSGTYPQGAKSCLRRSSKSLAGNEEDQKWIRSILKRNGANEPSNISRFTDLFSKVSDVLGISSKSSIKSLAFHIVATRNYYTHFNEDIIKDIFDDEKLYYTVILMKETLRIVLLRELGIQEDTIIRGSQYARDVRRANIKLGLK